MSKAGLNSNPAKMRPGCNQTRPGGASSLATTDDPEKLMIALQCGNRQTRRLALKNLRKAGR